MMFPRIRLPVTLSDRPVSDMEDEHAASVISGVVEEFEVVEEDVVPRFGVNLVHEFSRQAVVMQNIPSCIRGPMRMSSEEPGWKFILLL